MKDHYRNYDTLKRQWFIVCDVKTEMLEDGLIFELSRPWNDPHFCANCGVGFELKDLPPLGRRASKSAVRCKVN